MTPIVRVLLLVIAMSFAIAFAQNQSNREFLKPIDPQRRNDLMDRHALELKTLEFFAKPGKFDIYEYNMDVLETPGATFTITPFGGPSIELRSHGIWRNPQNRGFTASWRGSTVVPYSHGAYRAHLSMYVQSVDAEGKLSRPDPNREPTKSILENGGRINLNELHLPRDEKLVYGFPLSNKIQVPETKARITVATVGEELDYVLVYEVDEGKVLALGDASSINPTPASPEQVRRWKAYKAHVENVRRELGLPLDQE